MDHQIIVGLSVLVGFGIFALIGFVDSRRYEQKHRPKKKSGQKDPTTL